MGDYQAKAGDIISFYLTDEECKSVLLKSENRAHGLSFYLTDEECKLLLAWGI